MTNPEPSRAPASGNAVRTGESARKAELVARLLEYSAAHGLSDMSLRPLAAAVGSSPRVLLYFFGSKQEMIGEVLAASRAHQMELVDRWVHEGEPPGEGSLERLWQWLTDPAQADVERLFFECYGRSLRDRHGAWAGFGRDSVEDWLPFIARMLGGEQEADDAEILSTATLVLAVLRGLLLDLLATEDLQRVQRTFALLRHMLSSVTSVPPLGTPG
jgi:AcrR family transcriptional regulator